MIQRSLSLRILLVNFILLVLPLLLYFFLVFRNEYQGELIKATVALRELAQSRASLLSQTVKYGYETLSVISNLLDLRTSDIDLHRQEIDQLLTKYAHGWVYEINYFTSVHGDQYVISASSAPYKLGYNYTFREYLREAVNKGHSAYLAYHTESDAQDLFVSQAIYKEDHEPLGILSLVYSSKYLLNRLVSAEYAPFKARLSLLTADGIVFASSDPNFELHAISPITKKRLSEIEYNQQFGLHSITLDSTNLLPIKGAKNAYEWDSKDGVRIGVKVPVEGTTLSIFIDCDKNIIVETFYKHLWQLIVLISVATIVVSLINLWLTYRISTPLKQLFDVMHQIASGDYKKRFVNDTFGYEINSVGMMLNEMVSKLESNMEVAKTARAQRVLLAKELKIGRDIQMSILPQEMPQVEGVEISAVSLPALEVGGDFYDVYVTNNPANNEEKRLMLTIADGAGKGISACLYSLCLRSILRSYAAEYIEVVKLMQLSNNLFYLDAEKTDMFVTALTISFDPKTKQLSYYSAGHPPCLIRKKNGRVVRLETQGMAMGVSTIQDLIKESTIEVSSGDLIVLYTDGVTDAQTYKKELYGEKRFMEFLEKFGNLSAPEVVNNLYRDIETFSAGAKQYDDITVVVMRIL